MVLGLLKQGVRKYFAIFGHGSTDLGEVLRVYDEEGVTQTYQLSATRSRWRTPPQHCAGLRRDAGGRDLDWPRCGCRPWPARLAAASNGVGVFHIYGDETTHGEGYNMQQIPKREQGMSTAS